MNISSKIIDIKILNCLLFLIVLFGAASVKAQVCDLGLESFTGSSPSNPPAGWVRGPGTNIGASTPADPARDPAVGFNNENEYMISKTYTCAGEICFDWKASSVNAQHQVEVAYTQDDVNSNPVWVPIDTLVAVGSGNSSNVYVTQCYTLPANALFAPFDISIKWEMIQRTSSTFYLEDVCTNEGTCAVIPTELRFTEVPNGCKQTNTPVAVKVCATDLNGFVAETFTDVITVTQVSGPGMTSGTLSGNAVDGCFDAALSIDTEGSYTFSAADVSNTLMGTSPTIDVVDLCPNEDTLRVVSYNLLNYPDGRNDCGPNTVVPSRWDTLAIINSYVQPDVLMVCELQNEEGSDSIFTRSLNVNGVTKYGKANFVVNQSTAATAFNNMFFYNTDKMTLYSQEEILTGTRDFNKYTVYLNDPQLSVHQDTVFIDFYMAHLKAGSASADSIRRADDCLILRNYLDGRPERNNVLGGDLNFYTASEQAYQTLISGTYPFDDPADAEGDWDGNFAFAEVCTQSSRGPGDPSFDCGFGGGNDSRFDFLLTSTSIRDNTDNVSVIPDSYTPVGNDGSIYNKAINDAANTSGVPSSVLNSLYHMSDHLPVTLDLRIEYPTVAVNCPLMVTNTDDSGAGSLRDVIDCASSGDTIRFSPTIDEGVIIITSDSLVIDKDLVILSNVVQDITITSVDPRVPTLKTIFKIASGNNVVMSGLTISGAFGPEGSAICNEGTVTFENMNFLGENVAGLQSVVENRLGGSIEWIGINTIE